MALEVRRGGDEHQRVVLLRNTIQIAIEVDLIDIEVYTGEVGGVMAHATEILDTVVAAHIPSDVMGVPHHDLGYSGSPASAANDGYVSAFVHFDCSVLTLDLRYRP